MLLLLSVYKVPILILVSVYCPVGDTKVYKTLLRMTRGVGDRGTGMAGVPPTLAKIQKKNIEFSTISRSDVGTQPAHSVRRFCCCGIRPQGRPESLRCACLPHSVAPDNPQKGPKLNP